MRECREREPERVRAAVLGKQQPAVTQAPDSLLFRINPESIFDSTNVDVRILGFCVF